MGTKVISVRHIYCPICRKLHPAEGSFHYLSWVTLADHSVASFDPACFAETKNFAPFVNAALPKPKAIELKVVGKLDGVNIYEELRTVEE